MPPTTAAKAPRLPKRERTRQSLVDAAIRIIARAGMDGVSISAVTEEAGMANGTFYNHFTDKAEIVREAALRMLADVVESVAGEIAHVDDAAERFAFSTCRVVELAAADSDWGWALLHTLDHVNDFRLQTQQYLRADIERGLQQGRFTVEPDDLLYEVIIGAIAGGIRARLLNLSGVETGPKVSEHLLRLLGMSGKVAARVARN